MAMKHNIVLERTYPYSPEQVWAALTDPDALSEWLMDSDFQPFVGHKFQFRTEPGPGFDGVVNCEVIDVGRPHRLAYTWQGGPMKTPTTVTWTLEPLDNGTHLRLEHTGFEGLAGVVVSFILGPGWRKGLRDKLPAYLEHTAKGG